MKKVKILALIAAVIAGLGAYFFLEEAAKPAEIPQVRVVTAAAAIPENTLITEDMLTISSVFPDDVHEHSIKEIKSAVGLVASGHIYPGEQILTDRLVQTGELTESDSLAYKVESGMRAVTISVSAVTGLENLIHPGNRVDILCSYSYEKETEAGSDADIEVDPGEYDVKAGDGYKKTVAATAFLAQNVKVLAVGDHLGKDGASEYVTVTLELTPQQALLTAHGEYSASLRLILRSALDTQMLEPEVIDTDSFRRKVGTP